MEKTAGKATHLDKKEANYQLASLNTRMKTLKTPRTIYIKHKNLFIGPNKRIRKIE